MLRQQQKILQKERVEIARKTSETAVGKSTIESGAICFMANVVRSSESCADKCRLVCRSTGLGVVETEATLSKCLLLKTSNSDFTVIRLCQKPEIISLFLA